MKFKLGETVRVKTDLVMDKDYKMENSKYENTFVDPMKKYAGKTFKIKTVEECGYQLEGVPVWTWTDGMLEKVTKIINVKSEEIQPIKREVKSLSDIEREIKEHFKAIEKLKKMKKDRFNRKTLVLKLTEKCGVEDINLEILDKDISESIFAKTRENTILVYRYKNTLEAVVSKNGYPTGVGVAICHEDDEFNYYTGLLLAVNRANLDVYKKELNFIESWA